MAAAVDVRLPGMSGIDALPEIRKIGGDLPVLLITAYADLRQAVEQSGVEATVEKITDINVITGFGVMMTPALAVDGEVKSMGKVLSSADIKELLA